MSIRADAESLRQIALFRDCDPVALQIMSFAAERENFIAGQTILQEGLVARSAHFIMSGQVSIHSGDTEIAVAEPGSMLGETAMIGQKSYSISAYAKGPVMTARIDHALFLRVVNEYPDFGRAVAQALSRKLDASVRELDGVRTMLDKVRKFSDL